MRKSLIVLFGLFWVLFSHARAAERELEVHEVKLTLRQPALQLTLPSPFLLVHSLSQDRPRQSSRTRVFLLVNEKKKKVEELLLLQVAERTNPQAEPITAPALSPSSEETLYFRTRMKKEGRDLDLLIQLMALNPEAKLLEPVRQKGFSVPSHLALQGQSLFVYDLDHAVFLWYSKDIHTLGFRVSDQEDRWKRAKLSGNEKKAVDTFQKCFMSMVDSITLSKP